MRTPSERRMPERSKYNIDPKLNKMFQKKINLPKKPSLMFPKYLNFVIKRDLIIRASVMQNKAHSAQAFPLRKKNEFKFFHSSPKKGKFLSI